MHNDHQQSATEGRLKPPARFKNLGAVRAYLTQPKIRCLLCGAHFDNLGTHLRYAHSIDSDSYRLRFGIPFTYGLCSPELASRLAEKLRARYHDPAVSAVRVKVLRRIHSLGLQRVEKRRCPTLIDDSLDALDRRLLKGKAARMAHIRARLDFGADYRSQQRKARAEKRKAARNA
jgi:hypothetical protein